MEPAIATASAKTSAAHVVRGLPRFRRLGRPKLCCTCAVSLDSKTLVTGWSQRPLFVERFELRVQGQGPYGCRGVLVKRPGPHAMFSVRIHVAALLQDSGRCLLPWEQGNNNRQQGQLLNPQNEADVFVLLFFVARPPLARVEGVRWLGFMPRLVSTNFSSRAARYIRCHPLQGVLVRLWHFFGMFGQNTVWVGCPTVATLLIFPSS